MKESVSHKIKAFLVDESGQIEKHRILEAGAALVAAAAAAGIASAQITCPSCGPACGTSCHANCNGIVTQDGTHIGQHAHRIEQGGSCPPPLPPPSGGGGGWLFDALGTAQDPGAHNTGELLSFLIANAPTQQPRTYPLTLQTYHLIGVLFRINHIKGIPKGSWISMIQKWIPPKHDLAKDHWWAKSLLRAAAIQGHHASNKTLRELAKEGILEHVVMQYLEQISVSDQRRYTVAVTPANQQEHQKRMHACETAFIQNANMRTLEKMRTHATYKELMSESQIITPSLKMNHAERFWASILRYTLIAPIGNILYQRALQKACEEFQSQPMNQVQYNTYQVVTTSQCRYTLFLKKVPC